MTRNTEQRGAIEGVLLKADRPLSAVEILAGAQRNVAGLGIATVYRNVRRLLDEGQLAAVDIPGGATRYEVAGKEHHHHFVCRSCDRVLEVPACPADLEKMTPMGFMLDHHEVVLYGQCSDCRGGTAR
jgi:Fur family ferric uptake transcriptional regulator